MNISIGINESYTFTDSGITIWNPADDIYRSVPTTKGVYIFHAGPLNDAWADGQIFYIGAANRETLRSRVKKNARAKIPKLAKTGVNVSFVAIDNKASDYIPFLVEGYLLHEYRLKFNKLPFLNIGRR